MHTRTLDRRRTPVLARALSLAAVLLLMAIVLTPSGAGAVTKGQLEAAKNRLDAIQNQIDAQQNEVDRLQQESSTLALRVSDAIGQLQVTTGRLVETRERLETATARYNELVGRLEDRAREAFVAGGASNLEFLLSAESISDLSDRLEFVDQVSAADAEVAAEVQGLRNQLSEDKRTLEQLQAQQQRAVDRLQKDQAALEAQYAAQQDRLDQIEGLEADRKAEFEKLDKKYRAQLRAQLAASSGQVVSNGTFKVCPVGQPRAYGDDFGAPRYGGGYHLHAGNDILAPLGTPIYATFDGNASVASNGLGGLSVIVSGAAGYTYNAHLSRFGQMGSVRAGDVIGYVGNTGDAVGGPTHNHFEWHPKAIPGDWPSSSYGYSVIDDAVNPYPLLNGVC